MSKIGNLNDQKNARTQEEKKNYMKKRFFDGSQILDASRGSYPRALMIVQRIDSGGSNNQLE